MCIPQRWKFSRTGKSAIPLNVSDDLSLLILSHSDEPMGWIDEPEAPPSGRER